MNGLHVVQFHTILLDQSDPSIYYFMFNMFIDVPTRTSAAITSLSVDLLARKAIVTFKNGCTYEYDNVSARSIANVLFNPDISLGFWVNNNCIHSDRAIDQGPMLPDFV